MCAVATAFGALGFVITRLIIAGHGKATSFILAERRFVNPALAPHGLPILAKNGYDGQFYYRLALDPANLHRTAFGISMDVPARLQRIGYPAVAWLVALGHRPWVPVSLIAVNVLALAGMAWVGGELARSSGRHAAWGMVLAGYWGFVFGVSRDTTEPLAALFLLGALLALRRSRPILAGLLLCFGVLTRETVLVVVAAVGLTRIATFLAGRGRPGRAELAWVPPVAVFVGWQLVVNAVTGSYPYRSDAQNNLALPFRGLSHAISAHAHHPGASELVWFVEVAALFTIVIAALLCVTETTVPLHERLALVLITLQLAVLSSNVWVDLADLRTVDEGFLLAVLVLLGVARRRFALLVPPLAQPLLLVVLAHRVVSL